jgi:hypothetical protein
MGLGPELFDLMDPPPVFKGPGAEGGRGNRPTPMLGDLSPNQ